ncbi:GNAT family N-acetyltransferase [Rurimicrobium arvi]|uniref:GNAT family N-acetyltransferase n=1 Tax=Rurimicrobium arvi TaxID=2049916 RepID=A0ABP8MQU7_9BACT
MKFHIETPSLVLRELRPEDADGIFELDTDPLVHRYLGNNPIRSREQAEQTISFIMEQYAQHGIGRWAVIEKSSGSFAGWSGLKFITTVENNRTRFHDVGYRLLPRFWGKGYATESALAALAYGFSELQLEEIIGMANELNAASRRVLEKCGLRFVEQFMWNGITCDWLRIGAAEWQAQQQLQQQ